MNIIAFISQTKKLAKHVKFPRFTEKYLADRNFDPKVDIHTYFRHTNPCPYKLGKLKKKTRKSQQPVTRVCELRQDSDWQELSPPAPGVLLSVVLQTAYRTSHCPCS